MMAGNPDAPCLSCYTNHNHPAKPSIPSHQKSPHPPAFFKPFSKKVLLMLSPGPAGEKRGLGRHAWPEEQLTGELLGSSVGHGHGSGERSRRWAWYSLAEAARGQKNSPALVDSLQPPGALSSPRHLGRPCWQAHVLPTHLSAHQILGTTG